MTTELQSFTTQHSDLIHDAKFDYYGKRLASCSSDCTIRIFEVTEDQEQRETVVLKGHAGPVWCVDWAHPKFGTYLASCSYDHKVFIWTETRPNEWSRVYSFACESSVNSVNWAPAEVGLCLACASSDCALLVVTFDQRYLTWSTKTIKNAHSLGCTSVSWSSCTGPVGAMTSRHVPHDRAPLIEKRFVSGGCDCVAKIWKFDEESSEWATEAVLEGHNDWVRDVAWSPQIGLPYETIATAGQDQKVCIWKRGARDAPNVWRKAAELPFRSVVWRVSWSVTGNLLAVTTANNEVTLWKENMGEEGQWQQIGTVQEQDQGQ